MTRCGDGMTRYLDREPREGDRVWFAAEATYLRHDGDGTHRISVANTFLSVPSGDLAGVIAPEPKVGDVVTKDMDLPHRTIIEGGHQDLAFRADCRNHDQACWNHGGDHESLSWLLNSDEWRIVRIGDAS